MENEQKSDHENFVAHIVEEPVSNQLGLEYQRENIYYQTQ